MPDVSAEADPTTGYVVEWRGEWQAIGGTSGAAPLWAALLALVNADSACAGSPIGFATPAMYDIAGGSGYAGAFNDVTRGNNDGGGGHGTLYPAGTGYDMATGLGTPLASGGTTAKPTGLATDLCALGRSPGEVGRPRRLDRLGQPGLGPRERNIVLDDHRHPPHGGQDHLPVAGKSVTLTASGGSSKITPMSSGSAGPARDDGGERRRHLRGEGLRRPEGHLQRQRHDRPGGPHPHRDRDLHSRRRAPLVKGVLLAGGTGRRLHPLTRITNKHLLPIYDRPMIAYAHRGARRGRDQRDHGRHRRGPTPESSSACSRTARSTASSDCSYAYQDRPGGIAEALGLAERFVGDDPVLVMLADNIFERHDAADGRALQAQADGARIVLAESSEPEHLRHLGVPEIDAEGRVVRIVEKPDDPPSNYCVTGVYCYDPSVFSVISTLEPSGRGELEITDVNNHYIEQGEMAYDVLEGFWGDAGESIDAYYAVNDFVRAHGANAD